ncbi:glycosyltransferase involved in cell wall biosynthesis [Dysgonomonas sp. PH5-45]|uniref:glycosyltransferase family 4 protein n=1 Tax=unclassified Dysgonomonas TaxID=2630389 RepID=UPI002476A9F2|nr:MULTISPECIES: glycosyltransferase family 1 protein [unclassified Dysgonomonas]MDH6355300.1 glycosyltransferase involved in cell wall biosynthesis [Dysgonomonas sp. PH5-45]MDH6388174.1 glycosyltransferase involved in cell wall biosynthesis [Dysgonomonas sp. PH5-37]
MKVLFDHQIFQTQRFGGISRYFVEIMKHLPQEGVEVDLAVKYTFNEYLRDSGLPCEYNRQLVNEFLPQYKFRGQKAVVRLLEKYFPKKYPRMMHENYLYMRQKISAGDFDILHPTFFDDHFPAFLNKDKPYVLTVHDMIVELYPEFLNNPLFIKRKRQLAENAAHIIAVSENTKKDIVDLFDIDPNKISVAYHGSSLKETGSDIALPKRYILYVGDRRLGYKNFAFFVSSVLPILNEFADVQIVCTGNVFTSEEKVFFKNLGINDRVKHIFVSENDLFTIYNKAEMFMYPSYYEGFGIPILEAFQSWCPVVLADASCFREVAGDAALYFDPKSAKQLQNNVRALLTDKELRAGMIRKGTEQLEKYSWQKTAHDTANIYRKVLENRR